MKTLLVGFAAVVSSLATNSLAQPTISVSPAGDARPKPIPSQP